VTIGSADPLYVAARVAAALDAIDVAYSIGGSLAGSFAGEPRATLDIDMVVALEARQAGSHPFRIRVDATSTPAR
jgi:hypothetical protein